jgi:hypothetical protein
MINFVPFLGGDIWGFREEAEEFLASCSSGTTPEEIGGGFNDSYLLRHGNGDPLVKRHSVFFS